jgi:general secretion pathway protein M
MSPSDSAVIAKGTRAFPIPGLALVIYALLLIGGLLVIWTTYMEIASRATEVATIEEQVERLRTRLDVGNDQSQFYGFKASDGFLSGDKLTVAAAELQRRVEATIATAGGSVISSQMELGEEKSQTANIGLSIECQINQEGLQRMLYDLESTTPFLFIEKLDVRTRDDSQTAQPSGRLRIAIRVAAIWRGSRS